ncbi:hypothetical protein FNBNMHLP_03963 [Aeromonas jandaei]
MLIAAGGILPLLAGLADKELLAIVATPLPAGMAEGAQRGDATRVTVSRIEPGEALSFGAGFQRLGECLIGQLNICLIHLMVKRLGIDRGAASEAEQEEC